MIRGLRRPLASAVTLGLLVACTPATVEPDAAASAGAGPSASASADRGQGAAGEPSAGAGDLGGPGDPGDPAAYAAELVAGTNRVRVAEGLPRLASSACAAQVATQRARDLVGTPGLEHAPLDPVLAACAPATRAAENLSRAAAPPDDVVEAWMASPGHRQNLLSAEVTEIGIGCVPDAAQTVCSQVFLGP